MPDYTKTDAIDELIPALIQCFGVILLGYLAGRYKILREAEIRGLNSYVTKFALPAVFFKGMVTVDLTGVSWALVGAISLGKATVFFLAFATTLLLNRTSPFGMAAILSMFVSQSNDVALGYPVLKALYPELAIYVYLFAPAQLIILNPIAYLFLEWHQLKQESIDAEVKRLADGTDITPPASVSKYKRLLQVIWRVALNPLFFMTVIGVIFNFILSHNIPIYVDGLLRIIAESFAATALFTLGFGMVGKMGRITQREMLVLVSILMVKLPTELVQTVNDREPKKTPTTEFTVTTIRCQQNRKRVLKNIINERSSWVPGVSPLKTKSIGIGLVLGTFLCAPMIFILARMITMYMADRSKYDQLLDSTVVDISWISIAGCVWTLFILLLSRKAFRVPHRFTCCYLLCIVLSCFGVVIGHFLNRTMFDTNGRLIPNDGFLNQPANVLHYLQFSVFFIGCTGARVWTALIALSMFLERLRSTCFVLRIQGWIYLVGFATPVLVTSILLCTSSRQRIKDIDPVFQYGIGQLVVSLVVLLVSLCGTVLFLICYVRLGSAERTISHARCSLVCVSPMTENGESKQWIVNQSSNEVGEEANGESSTSEPDERQNQRLLRGSVTSCKCGTAETRRRCLRAMARYGELCKVSTASAADNSPDELEFQHTRHLVLLFLLLTTMFFGICLCVWRLVRDAPSGVYLVLEFLDGTFNFGQGLVLFIIFGLDGDLILDPTRRYITRQSRRLFGAMLEATGGGFVGTTVRCPSQDKEKAHQFQTYHIVSCATSIAKDAVSGDRHLKVFSEDSLKLWLSQSGLVHSETEATEYVAALMAENVVNEVRPYEVSSGSELTLYSDRVLYFTERDYPEMERAAFLE
ncbi:Integral membrane protein gpr155 [Clonorchis sinensis]|uniref:Integral membrane protein gpr155 n=1 Tax=Clonorchis sinensis TaxID=79923 RepID=A0A419PF52_CLOSI|nr:Integral membrane protein gpr155 [Clonorchis sinensis]